jgi:hypothetical protein
MVGAWTFYWAIWFSHNEIVFDKVSIKSLFQVLYTRMY